MAEAIWKPHATVASLCERDGRYLLVKESIDDREVYNQPAGHLEPGESLIDAVIRETLEETRYPFTPTGLQGVYRYCSDTEKGRTYLRFLFRGEVGDRLEGALDQGIIAAEWLSYDLRRPTKRPLQRRARRLQRLHPSGLGAVCRSS